MLFRIIRWSNSVYCPNCNSFKIYNREKDVMFIDILNMWI